MNGYGIVLAVFWFFLVLFVSGLWSNAWRWFLALIIPKRVLIWRMERYRELWQDAVRDREHYRAKWMRGWSAMDEADIIEEYQNPPAQIGKGWTETRIDEDGSDIAFEINYGQR